MRKSPITIDERREPIVVVIGGPNALVVAARHVARQVDAGLVAAAMPDASTVVAKHRPFAIVIGAELYAFDPTEFDALARDVGAAVISLETVMQTPEKVVELLSRQMVAARARYTGG